MKRRGFLGALAFVVPAALAIPREENPDDFLFRGWQIKWRGWAVDPFSDRSFGGWIATLKDPTQAKPPAFQDKIACAVPGRPVYGSHFDTSDPEHVELAVHSKASEMEEAKGRGLSRLKQFILDEEKPKPEYEFKFSGFKYSGPSVGAPGFKRNRG